MKSSRVWILIQGKSGPLGSEPTDVMLDSKTRMFPTITALIFVSLDVDAELDEVPTMKSLLLLTFSRTSRSTRHSFLVGEMK